MEPTNTGSGAGMKVVVTIVVIAVVVIGYFWFTNMINQGGPATPTTPTTPTTPSVPTTPNKLSTQDQAGGTEVFIGNASLTDGGYVVILRDEGGKPGKIIGVSPYYPAKTNLTNFSIKLNEAVKTGDKLVAMLYGDDGDLKFDATKDKPLLGADGNPILVRFTIVDEGKLQNESKL